MTISFYVPTGEMQDLLIETISCTPKAAGYGCPAAQLYAKGLVSGRERWCGSEMSSYSQERNGHQPYAIRNLGVVSLDGYGGNRLDRRDPSLRV
jgi:hypothetical protein